MRRSGTIINLANEVLATKAVRTWLIANPGRSTAQFLDARGRADLDRLYYLEDIGLAEFRPAQDGFLKWYAKPGIAHTKEKKS